MRDTIIRRRTAIETELRARLPDAAEFERSREGSVSVGRPRTSGQVFLATFDGLASEREFEPLTSDRALPAAVALELASMQRRAHRTAFERARSTTGDDDPTRDILRGDLLESTAFETILDVHAPSRVVARCFGVLARASRRVQEGHAMSADVDDSGSDSNGGDDDGDSIRYADRDVVRRLGALTGGAIELAVTLADVDIEDDARRRLVDRGSAFGFRVWAHSLGDGAVPTAVPSSLEACRRELDAFVERAPADASERIGRQLRAFLETAVSCEFVESTA